MGKLRIGLLGAGLMLLGAGLPSGPAHASTITVNIDEGANSFLFIPANLNNTAANPIPGDVILCENGVTAAAPGCVGGVISDILDISQQHDDAGLLLSTTITFFSDNSDGTDAPADTGFDRVLLQDNQVFIPEVGPEIGPNGAIYTPGPNDPGFFSFVLQDVTFTPIYDVASDPTPVPEPATLGLFGAALAGIGFLRGRKSA